MMSEQRKALHDLVAKTREEDIDRLLDFMTRFRRPPEFPRSQKMVFEPISPESKTTAQIEDQWQQALTRRRARQLELLTRHLGTIAARLGIDLNRAAEGGYGSSSSRGGLMEFSCNWFEERVFNRLSTSYLHEHQIVVFERFFIAEGEPQLIYKSRVLASNADGDKELNIPL